MRCVLYTPSNGREEYCITSDNFNFWYYLDVVISYDEYNIYDKKINNLEVLSKFQNTSRERKRVVHPKINIKIG